MKQPITDFHKDSEDHWVAELACGHAQHVRHDPPWMEREWVTTPEGRASRIGTELNCVRCDEAGRNVAQEMLVACKDSLRAAYESAGMAGLCDEGRWEAALGGFNQINLDQVLERALKQKP